MADKPKDVGKGHRIRASLQRYEVRFIADKFNIPWQAALAAIKAAGPMREKVYEYLRARLPKR